MRPITDTLKEGQWSGRRAFVVGSGPSLTGFNFGLLKHDLTIGCNDEYKWGPTIAICQDPRFFNGDGTPDRIPARLNPAWVQGPHTPVYFKGHPEQEEFEAPDTVFKIISDHGLGREFKWGKTLAGGLYYGANVGMAALNLAEILGADPIYLLGFDANPEIPQTHHHDSYPQAWCMENQDDRAAVYGRWIKEFRRIAPMIKAKVYNLNMLSGIDAFPKRQPYVFKDSIQVLPVGM